MSRDLQSLHEFEQSILIAMQVSTTDRSVLAVRVLSAGLACSERELTPQILRLVPSCSITINDLPDSCGPFIASAQYFLLNSVVGQKKFTMVAPFSA